MKQDFKDKMTTSWVVIIYLNLFKLILAYLIYFLQIKIDP